METCPVAVEAGVPTGLPDLAALTAEVQTLTGERPSVEGGCPPPPSDPRLASPAEVQEPCAATAHRERSPAASNGSVEDGPPPPPHGGAALEDARTDPEGARAKKREDKGIDHVLRALASLQTTEEKLAALCKKYTELLDQHRLMQNKFKQNQKKLTVTCREKDHLQSEHSKAVLAKSKLESLCRELQKHNKLIKDESVARARDEEEKRKEATTKFQTTINDIQKQMNENYDKNNKLREENVELASKLKNLIEQYELREQHIEKVFKHKELEQQLIDAKLAQANLQTAEEKERGLKERQMLIHEACDSQKKVEILEMQERQLRGQVAMYTEKYEEFQTTLSKSNEVFASFKSEMEKMTKKIKKLEKETTMWRSRWENSSKALIEMAEEKTKSDKEMGLLNSKVAKLESLCRALQEERKKLTASKAAKTPVPAAAPAPKEPSPLEPTLDAVIEPTKTPPNTPEGGSRGSPVNLPPATLNGPQTAEICQPANQDPALQVAANQEAAEPVVNGSHCEGTAQPVIGEEEASPPVAEGETGDQQTPAPADTPPSQDSAEQDVDK